MAAIQRLQTRHGMVAVRQSGVGIPLVFLHGNSSSMRCFDRQFTSAMAARWRLVAVDLPGHGRSDDASDPQTAYSLPGYADAVLDALDALGIEECVLVGWSLGGHVAMEIASRWPGVIGLAICGAPPASLSGGGLMEAFRPNPLIPLLASPVLRDSDATMLVDAFFGDAAPAFAAADIRRTDGRARTVLFESLGSGKAADERILVETSPIPIAVLDGFDEPFASRCYMEGLSFAALWQDRLHRIPGSGHAPFWQSARTFNRLLERFAGQITTTAVRTPSMAWASAPGRAAANV